jgi:ABC-2 type transport system permease protein
MRSHSIPRAIPRQPPEPRVFGAVNWRGLWTLYVKEVRRFLNVYTQTLLAPMITTLLFLAIFTLALGRAVRQVGGVSYAEFLAPGLIMMAMVQNAFANTSSSIVIAKVQGNIVDLLMPPLTAGELACGMACAGVSRGVLVGLAVALGMWFFVPMRLHDPVFVVYHAINASLMLALLGMIGGIWAERFDHIAAVTNFVITPLSFLSGTFYTIDRLPESWQVVALLNPFFYMIDGFRYGFIGHADGPLGVGLLAVLAVNLALLATVHRMLVTGYRLKP